MSVPARSVRISGPRCARPLGPLDARDNAWRADLADIELADRVAVPHYVKPVEMQVLRQVPLLAADRPDALSVSELLPGERFALLDSGHGYGWGFGTHDRYVGHVSLDALGAVPENTGEAAIIGPGDALVFAEPLVKSQVLAALPAGSRVEVRPHDDRFVALGSGGFLHRRHLLEAGGDWVSIATNFLGAPYRWGGRSRAGIDCSGLVQMARMLAGHPCRRDSDMQYADAPNTVEKAMRGDIAWWPGHIGILLDEGRLLHANGHWMACVIEPLSDVVARSVASGGAGQPQFRRF